MDNLLLLKPGETLWMPVLSGSMAPLYLPGDEVLVEAVSKEELPEILKPGLVAVFYETGRFYFHRILRVRRLGGTVYQKGDGNSEGYWIGNERIIGLVRKGRRKDNNGFLYYGDAKPGPCSILYGRTVMRRWEISFKGIIKKCLHMG